MVLRLDALGTTLTTTTTLAQIATVAIRLTLFLGHVAEIALPVITRLRMVNTSEQGRVTTTLTRMPETLVPF